MSLASVGPSFLFLVTASLGLSRTKNSKDEPTEARHNRDQAKCLSLRPYVKVFDPPALCHAVFLMSAYVCLCSAMSGIPGMSGVVGMSRSCLSFHCFSGYVFLFFPMYRYVRDADDWDVWDVWGMSGMSGNYGLSGYAKRQKLPNALCLLGLCVGIM